MGQTVGIALKYGTATTPWVRVKAHFGVRSGKIVQIGGTRDGVPLRILETL
jgi:hypothetical protein